METQPFTTLTPDTVLAAVDATGLATTGTLLAMGSYENRVYQVGIQAPDGAQAFIIAKFYRPGRWTDAQILEEHAFLNDLAQAEIPTVVACTLRGRSLHLFGEHRLAIFERQGGRAPNLDDPQQRIRLGRLLGRIHAVGARQDFKERISLDIDSYGHSARAYLIEHKVLPWLHRKTYEIVSAQALAEVARAFERAGEVRQLRIHGDVHPGNVLATDTGVHFVDFDDSCMGPAIQDLWMLLGHTPEEQREHLADLLAGYTAFADFNPRELHLIEALRTLRLIHHSAWIARRWDDPAFPLAFPWFGEHSYWELRIGELRQQIAALRAPSLSI